MHDQIALPENVGLKMQDRKCKTGKWRIKTFRKNAGLKNAKPKMQD